MLPNVHGSTMYNIQDMEATEVDRTDEWVNKMGYMHTVHYYSVIKG